MKLGQYTYGSSAVHALDPRTKIVCCLIAVVAVLLSQSLVYLGALGAAAALLIVASRLDLKYVLRSLSRLGFFFLCLLLFQAFLTPGTAVVQAGPLIATREGLLSGAEDILRLAILFLCSMTLLMTTSPLRLSAAIEYLAMPLARLKIPVHDLATVLGIAFRFLPVVFEEAVIIRNAQKSRGAQFDSGNVLARVMSHTSVLIPLFERSLTRAAELGEAMDSRCYTSHPNRTRMEGLGVGSKDAIAVALMTAVLSASIVLRFI